MVQATDASEYLTFTLRVLVCSRVESSSGHIDEVEQNYVTMDCWRMEAWQLWLQMAWV